MVFWDTAGDESYDRFRPWCYSDADVFLACYSTVDPTSLTNVYQKWIKEIRMSRPNTPIVVVGTKSDARVNHVQRCLNARSGTVVTTDQGAVFAKAAGAIFVECSALSSRGIKEVLLATTRAGRRANTEVTTPAAPTENTDFRVSSQHLQRSCRRGFMGPRKRKVAVRALPRDLTRISSCEGSERSSLKRQ